jgi:hypothetical protein
MKGHRTMSLKELKRKPVLEQVACGQMKKGVCSAL